MCSRSRSLPHRRSHGPEEDPSDPEVSDAPDDAANLVRYIRSDEAPHVEYLRTALSEIQARTLLTLDGKPISGRKVVNDLADRGIRTMLRQRLNERPVMVRDLIRKTAKVKDVDALMREFDALGTAWIPPARYGGFGAECERGGGACRVLNPNFRSFIFPRPTRGRGLG